MKSHHDCLYNESAACQRIVALGGGSKTRNMVANVLRDWRTIGKPERAVWFRRHAYYISGHLYKDSAANLRTDLLPLSAK